MYEFRCQSKTTSNVLMALSTNATHQPRDEEMVWEGIGKERSGTKRCHVLGNNSRSIRPHSQLPVPSTQERQQEPPSPLSTHSLRRRGKSFEKNTTL